MVNGRFSVFFLSLFLALLSVLSPPLYSTEQADHIPGENQQGSTGALNRLIEISEQLSILNANLRNELQESRRNSTELQNMLEASKKELDEMRQELETLRNASTELLNRAAYSLTESTELTAALNKAEYSLVSLEQSFSAYRTQAESRVQSLERENRLWKWGFIITGVLAAGLTAGLVLSQ